MQSKVSNNDALVDTFICLHVSYGSTRVAQHPHADAPDDDDTIPFSTVDGEILKIILEYCERKSRQPSAVVDPPKFDSRGRPFCADCMDPAEKEAERQRKLEEEQGAEWERKLAQSLTHGVLFPLVVAANFLNCKPLLNVLCSEIANQIRGKTPQQLREHFNIKNDFTPEEQKQIEEDDRWLLGGEA